MTLRDWFRRTFQMSDDPRLHASDFGDKDAEDAYDATDPTEVRLDVMERIVAQLRDNNGDSRREHRILDALRLVNNLESAPDIDLPRLAVIRYELEQM